MKKIVLIMLICCAMCTKKEEVVETFSYSYIELDRARIEQVMILLPIILKKATEFQTRNHNISDEEYNTRFYEYLYSEKAFADRLERGGFEDAISYENFYSEMIEMYMLLLAQPETVETAKIEMPNLEKEIISLTLRQAQEPNNEKLTQTLQRYQYQLTTYKNLILVDEFLPQLNSFNE